MSENIKVSVRVRPFLQSETPNGCIKVAQNQLMVGDNRSFAFDHVFDSQTPNDDIYVVIGQPLADAFLSGYNTSIIAYGQTGSGKTYTMSALTADVIQELFCRLSEEASSQPDPSKYFSLRVSALEVYNETLSDLLSTEMNGGRKGSTAGSSSHQLQLREDPKGGVYIPGLLEKQVFTESELITLVDKATANRKTASTLMNATSSRSHCVVTLLLEKKGIVSKYCFIDLAGSERLKRSIGISEAHNPGSPSSTGGNNLMGELSASNMADRMKEGISINSGLLALGNVIVALCEKKPHVPYRSSKLTRLLQPMLGGNSKTSMVACVSPHASSLEESLNTLKYADRAKSIKTDPHLVITQFHSYDEAERTIVALRKEVEQLQISISQQKMGSDEGSKEENQKQFAELQAQVSDLQILLLKEQRLTKRLEDDLFKAEYTAMVEIEKRKAVEARLAELEEGGELITSPNISLEDDNSSQPSDGGVQRNPSLRSPSYSPGETALTKEKRENSIRNHDQNSFEKKLKQLEAERDSLEALRAQRVEDSVRLAMALGNEELPAGERCQSEERHVELLEMEIENKKKMIENLEAERNEAVNRLSKFERELNDVGTAKSRLEEELLKAESRLEASEMERQRKEEEKKKLNEAYKERIRKAEEKAIEYKRRVKQAEHEVKVRNDDIERTKQLQAKVEDLREELSRQRMNTRAEQKKVISLNAAHSQEVNALQRNIKQAEEEIAKYQAKLARKEEEILRTKRKISASNSSFAGDTSPQKFGRRNTYAYVPSGGNTGNGEGNNASPLITEKEIQKEIEYELKILERFEKDTVELEKYREALRQSQDVEAPKWSRAVQGFQQRLARIEVELTKDTVPASVKGKLESEKVQINATLEQLQAFKSMFEEAANQLAEFDSRIESMNDARKFHLHRVRDLQNRLDNLNSKRQGTRSFTRNNTSPAEYLSHNGNTDESYETPSVMDIRSSRSKPKKKKKSKRTAQTNESPSDRAAILNLQMELEQLRAENKLIKLQLENKS